MEPEKIAKPDGPKLLTAVKQLRKALDGIEDNETVSIFVQTIESDGDVNVSTGEIEIEVPAEILRHMAINLVNMADMAAREEKP